MFAPILGATVVSLACVLPSLANAQTIRPECVKMKDKIGCTCALNNGGGIKQNGHWYSVPGRSNAPRNQAFTDCVARGGR